MKKKNHIDTNTRAGKVFDVVNVVFMIVMMFMIMVVTAAAIVFVCHKL